MSQILDVDLIQARLRRFAAERDWEKYHTPKNLAMALAAEAGELIEIFQWMTPEESMEVMKDARTASAVRMEIADILGYLIRLGDVVNVDLGQALDEVLERNAWRFPPAG
jgi:NTP pyrophosphatase (non-canonical NTP hydrolase)